MTFATDWHDLGALIDGVVDAQWGEAVEITPYTGIDGYSAPVPDLSRPTVQVMAEIFEAGAVESLGGPMGRSGFLARMAEGEILLSLAADAVLEARAGDRVIRISPSDTFEISRIVMDDGFGRAALYVTRL